MRKIYYLKTCDTSMRILKQIPLESFVLQEIKTEPLTVDQLDEMKDLSGSYESLFSRRAKKYKEMGLKDQNLSEKDYKQLILDHYTFLKRPVIIIDNFISVGSSKKTIELLLVKIK
jgi:arsenate reductase